MQCMIKPSWIRSKLPYSENFHRIKNVVSALNINTVCREAACPNTGQCWSNGEATFLLLGRNCTRHCRFCNVLDSVPEKLDEGEPYNTAIAVQTLALKYAVITSVTRDDLPDGGAGHFKKTVAEIKKICPDTIIEILIPDFFANIELIREIAFCGADVIGHNIETVGRLYPSLRPGASYERSLNVLTALKKYSNAVVKSALIAGMGETINEIKDALMDIRQSGVDIIHIGQYLRPNMQNTAVLKYYSLDEFNELENIARGIGFLGVAAGPMVRSSYRAGETYDESRGVL